MSNYTAKDITVLEGLEPVRKRPGMYIGGVGTAGLHHLVWEILDNAVDEAMNGHASNIDVTLHQDGIVDHRRDDGRGIPVDKHPTTKKSALEVIFTVLHAGGKFEQGNYKTAGGLHGVGASVVNALSTRAARDRQARRRAVGDASSAGSRPGQLKKVGAARGTGTTVYFHPDSTIFPKIEFDAAMIRERLEIASYIHKGVKVIFENEADRQEGGLRARGRAPRLPEEDPRRARREAGARAPFVLERDERAAARSRAAVDRGDRRAHPQLRQRHPDRLRRHARERPARRPRQGDAQLHRHAQPLAERRDADGGRHPRRRDRRAEHLHRRSRSSRARRRIG